MLPLATALGITLCAMGHAVAQPPPDPVAPSLALPGDPAPPIPRVALSTDLVGVVLQDYSVEFQYAVEPSHSLWVRPRFNLGDRAQLELGYHWMPLGRGVSGLRLGPSLAAGLRRGDPVRVSVSGALEAGVQWVWGRLLVGVLGGAGLRRTLKPGQGFIPLGRIRLAVGLAWM